MEATTLFLSNFACTANIFHNNLHENALNAKGIWNVSSHSGTSLLRFNLEYMKRFMGYLKRAALTSTATGSLDVETGL